ncbi:hypothetical protein RB595_010053 [Gaeumannomyces hyphopodioides]
MGDSGTRPKEVNILTLNCWGIPYVSRESSRRLSEIGRHIAQADPVPHIVGLQECFSKEDFERIWQETRSVLPYAKHYYAGPFGAGLAILSRWPIEETSVIRYPLNGYPTAFYHGDWYVGKGVARATIRYGEAPDSVIEVFNTHMHAYYSSESDYLCHRVGQAWEFAKLLRAASRRHGGALVVGLGDFNTGPNSLPMRVLKYRAPDMHDAWLEDPLRRGIPAGGGEQNGTNDASGSVGMQNGATYGSPYNTWQWTRIQRAQYLTGQPDTPTVNLVLPPELDHSQAVRIDYVLASVASQFHTTSHGRSTGDACEDDGVWAVKSAKVGVLDRHPTLGCSLSDHFGVQVTLVFQQRRQSPGDGVPVETDAEGLLDEVLGVLRDYASVRKRHAWWRNVRSGVAGTVLIGSLAGVWAVDGLGWARLLLGIAGASILGFALLDGWGGLLFNLAEGAALREFEWEVRNAKDRDSERLGNELALNY